MANWYIFIFDRVEKYKILLNLKLDPEADFYGNGDKLSLKASLFAPPEDTPVDLYFGLKRIGGPLVTAPIWFVGQITPLVKNTTIPANTEITDVTILDILLPSNAPPINEDGTYFFVLAAAEPNTTNFVSNIALTTNFGYRFEDWNLY